MCRHVDQLVTGLREQLTRSGIDHIRPRPGLLDPDGLFDLPVDLALSPRALLSCVVDEGRFIYEATGLTEQVGPFAYRTEGDSEALLGTRVVAVAPSEESVATSLVCVQRALMAHLARNPPGRILSL